MKNNGNISNKNTFDNKNLFSAFSGGCLFRADMRKARRYEEADPFSVFPWAMFAAIPTYPRFVEFLRRINELQIEKAKLWDVIGV